MALTAQGGLTLDGGRITAVAPESDGGQILINSEPFVQLKGSVVETTVKGQDSGAELFIDTQVLVLDDARVSLNSELRDPRFGFTERLLSTADSTIELNSTALDLGDLSTSLDLEVLPTAYIDVTEEMREGCGARRGGDGGSSFQRQGRRTFPSEPDALLSGSYADVLDRPSVAATATKMGRLVLSDFVLSCGG